MSTSHSIRISLNIKDQNIIFSNNWVDERLVKGVQSLVYHARLSPDTPSFCPNCGVVNQNFDIIKNGSKSVLVKMPRVSNMKTFLNLRKQRYFCKNCKKTFCAQTPIVHFNHSISTNTYHASVLDAKNKVSIKDIAARHDISHGTLNQWIHELDKKFSVNFDSLPDHLSFDEFRSVKSVAHKMSFIYLDSNTGKILDIVQDRRLSYLKSYFNLYPLDVRLKVKTICIDMYEPYIQLIHSCFPKAKIITDRFHIVQHINRALNSIRIQVMKDNTKYYARLKRYWKLILKDNMKLDDQNYRKFTGYHYLMTEAQVVDDLIRQSRELEDTYYLCQKLKQAVRNRSAEHFMKLIQSPTSNLPKQMKIALRTFNKQKQYIANAMKYPYSNGKIEGTNNLIKVIKRIAFGYRDFYNFRARILLISNTMVHLDTKKPLSHHCDSGRNSYQLGFSHQH